MFDRESSLNHVDHGDLDCVDLVYGHLGASLMEPVAKPLDVLRARTCDCHERVESGMAWHIGFASLKNYRRLLAAFASVVIPIESRIAELLDPLPPAYRPTDRSQWLHSDLNGLDNLQDPAATQQQNRSTIRPVDVGYLFDQSGAIGALYVLEGSTLGGQVLSRQLQSTLPLAATHGGRYFASRGSQTVVYWREFTAWANQRLQQLAGTEAAVQAARETFNCFERNITGQTYE